MTMTNDATDLPEDIDAPDELGEPEVVEEPEDVEVLNEDGGDSRSSSDALTASSSALSRRDPLGVYMRDVQRYPLLSKDEEHELAVRYFEDEDVEAARRLVTSNLRLVVKIAYDYRQAYKNILDLVQEGNIGLMQAVKKYDPYKGVKLSSYASTTTGWSKSVRPKLSASSSSISKRRKRVCRRWASNRRRS